MPFGIRKLSPSGTQTGPIDVGIAGYSAINMNMLHGFPPAAKGDRQQREQAEANEGAD